MDPWNIIGWAIIFAIALAILFGSYVLYWVWWMPKWKSWRLWRRDRHLKPKKGDTWIQDITTKIHIKQVYDDGAISMWSGNAAWSDTAEAWEERRKNRRLWRQSEEKPLTLVWDTTKKTLDATKQGRN